MSVDQDPPIKLETVRKIMLWAGAMGLLSGVGALIVAIMLVATPR
jgi:hypothetical protein